MKNEKKFLICEAPLCKGSPTEGTEDAYSHLTGNGLKALFGERAVFSDYRGERCAGESGRRDMKHLETVMLVNRNVYTSLRRAHEEGYLPIMLGGDHSLAMASIAATSDVYGAGNVAVIYIDSHADINTEATSETGMIHGMPLAAAMGLCGDELNVGERKTHIYGKNVYIIGAHSIDRGEYPIIEREGVHLYTADDVRERGANDVASEVLASVRGMDVHLSFDVDSINGADFPATGYALKDSLPYGVIKEFLSKIWNGSDSIRSVDVVEYCPRLDPDSASLSKMLEIFSIFFNQGRRPYYPAKGRPPFGNP
ncbi:MAG: arginase family protein [Clostridia bacterium]|nr:arginase family protein [Clostridia bacterium]